MKKKKKKKKFAYNGLSRAWLRGGIRGGAGDSGKPPFDSKYHFLGKFRKVDEFGIPYLSQIFASLTLYLKILFNCILLPMNVWVANSVDPDQTPRSAASDLGLHCLLKPVSPNTQSRYGNLIISNPSKKSSWIRPWPGSLGLSWYLWKWCSAHVYARGHKHCCKRHLCLWRVSVKPRLQFSTCNVFFASKGNLFDYYLITNHVTEMSPCIMEQSIIEAAHDKTYNDWPARESRRSLNIALGFFLQVVEYSISTLRTVLYLPGRRFVTIPANMKKS